MKKWIKFYEDSGWSSHPSPASSCFEKFKNFFTLW
jgi:hypothetical protein